MLYETERGRIWTEAAQSGFAFREGYTYSLKFLNGSWRLCKCPRGRESDEILSEDGSIKTAWTVTEKGEI